LTTPPATRPGTLAGRLLLLAGGDPVSAKAALAHSPWHALRGFCMGSADVIPGVSGGTMALILGIYERLLKAIRSFDRDWLTSLLHLRIAEALARNDLLFLLPLGFGIMLAILFFTRVVPLPALIISHPEIIYGLFFGLILASVFILMGEVDRYGPKEVVITAVGVLLGFLIVNMVPVETPTSAWFIFVCGFIAICAMLLPGISGSFILLVLGKYAYIIDALGDFDLGVIFTFAAGALAGVIAFSRAIVWLLAHYRQATLLVIKGILIGSLWIIWPFQERVYAIVHGEAKLVGASPAWPDALDGTVLASFALLLAGFVFVLAIDRLAKRPAAKSGETG
jgi:putative membrane protein